MSLFDLPILQEAVLPFLLVFVIVFAVLQKTKLLGEGKTQIDALVALAIGLILIAVPTPRNYIVDMTPWLAVALVVLLIFFLIYGFAAADNKDGLKLEPWIKNTVLWIAVGFVVVLVLVITGVWDNRQEYIDSGVVGNLLIIGAVGVALWVALKKEDK